ncbi:hypothetical protein GQ54DRAFT_44289 [Martensiomyces pterosporus]|nr:hypothetical protein GQ54DRAFT_44289 [Martensiomyces pterosporus]
MPPALRPESGIHKPGSSSTASLPRLASGAPPNRGSSNPTLADLAKKGSSTGAGSLTKLPPLGLAARNDGSKPTGGFRPVGLTSTKPSASGTPPSLKSLASLGRPTGSLRGLASLGSKPPNLPAAAARSTPSVAGQALAVLKTRGPPEGTNKSAPDAAAVSEDKLSLAKQGLSQLSIQQKRTAAVPQLKNFAGRSVPMLKAVARSEAPESQESALGQHARRRAVLTVDRLPVAPPTLYAEPSPLASFILEDLAQSRTMDALSAVSETASLAIIDGLRREIQELIAANKKVAREQAARRRRQPRQLPV